MNDFTGWKIDPLRGKVITLRREELVIKKYEDGWRHVNYKGAKIGLSAIEDFLEKQNKKESRPYDIVLDYMLTNYPETHPCVAVHYWLIKYRIYPNKQISPSLFKSQYKHLFKKVKKHTQTT